MKILSQKSAIATIAIVASMLIGCGGDRSTRYDATGKKIGGGHKQAWITDSDDGMAMIAHNFVYIPGGFDVDGDGRNESGFWLAKYEARETNSSIATANLGSVPDLIRSSFLIYDPQSGYFDRQLPADSAAYQNKPLSDILGFRAHRVYFGADENATGGYSAIEAVVALAHSQIEGVQWDIGLPSEKQWMQVVKLAINNPANWSGGKVGEGKLYQGVRHDGTDRRYLVISNGIMGKDTHVPDDYSVRVYDLSGNLAEWTTGMFAIDDRFNGGDGGKAEYTQLGNNVPKWWLPIVEGASSPLAAIYGAGAYYDGSTTSGAVDTLDITGQTGSVDPYAVVARGGSAARGDQSLTGVGAAKLDFGPGYKDPSIGFRGATEYIGE